MPGQTQTDRDAQEILRRLALFGDSPKPPSPLAHVVAVFERQREEYKALVSEILTTLNLQQNRENLANDKSALGRFFEIVDAWSLREARIAAMAVARPIRDALEAIIPFPDGAQIPVVGVDDRTEVALHDRS